MTHIASVTVDASKSSRGMVRVPSGLQFLTEGWSASRRPWNSATGIDRLEELSFQISAKDRFMFSSLELLILKAWFSFGVLNLLFLRPKQQQLQKLAWSSLVLGGSNPYNTILLKRHPVPT
nr:hypothetical protein [Tanacetum cinerariifolium]